MRITQLAERRRNEKATAEVRAVREMTQKAVEQKKAPEVAAQTTEAATA